MGDQVAWMKVSEAAGVLGIHRMTLYRWVKEGLVEHVRTPTGRILVSSGWVGKQVWRVRDGHTR